MAALHRHSEFVNALSCEPRRAVRIRRAAAGCRSPPRPTARSNPDDSGFTAESGHG